MKMCCEPWPENRKVTGWVGDVARPLGYCARVARLQRVGGARAVGANNGAHILIKRSARRQGVTNIGDVFFGMLAKMLGEARRSRVKRGRILGGNDRHMHRLANSARTPPAAAPR